MSGEDEHDRPDEEDVPKESGPFSLIFTRYRGAMDALREFFGHLNPVVSSLDIDTTKRRDDKLKELSEDFARRANDDDKKAFREFGEFLRDGPPTSGESKKLQIGTELFGETLVRLFQAFRKMTPSESHRELLNRSILISLVGYFEQLVADLAHAYYSLVPEAAANDDKVLSVNDLRSFESVQEAMDFVVSKRVDDLLRGSLEDWDTFFSKRMNTAMLELVPDEAQWAEMIQRRHVIVHAGGTVTRRYLEKVNWQEVSWPAAKPSLEDNLPVEDLYLERALDLFEIVGLLLCQKIWKKLEKDAVRMRHDYTEGLGAAIYVRLESRNWYVAEHLASWGANDGDADEGTRLICLFNKCLSAKHQGRFDDVVGELENLDLSAKGAIYRLGCAALMERSDDFYRYLPEAIASGVTEENLRSWPIMEDMRTDDRFESELAKAFESSTTPAGNSNGSSGLASEKEAAN